MQTKYWLGLLSTAVLCATLPLGAADTPADVAAIFHRNNIPRFPDEYYERLDQRTTRANGRITMCPSSSALSHGKKQDRPLRYAWAAAGAWQDALTNETSSKQHWAFVAPKRPNLPAVQNDGWVRNPIDRFILARLEKEGLGPAREA